MSVAAKLAAAFGLLLFLFGAAVAFQAHTTRRAVSTGYALAGIFNRLELTANNQLAELDQIDEMASKLAITFDTGYAGGLDNAVHAFDASLKTDTGIALTPTELDELRQLRALWGDLPARAVAFEAAVAAHDTREVATQKETLLARVGALRTQTHRLSDASRADLRARLQRSAAAARESERISAGLALAALLFSILVATWIVRSIAGSLRTLRRGTHNVAEGNFDYRLEPASRDEFAELARDFNRMTERLGALDRMKQDFLSRVSHDLKTPLASMQETSRILLDGVAGELTVDQRRMLELNLESGRRLSAMIGKILELSALEVGAAPPERRPTDLAALVRRVAELVAPTVVEDRITLATDIPTGPVPVECDAERIQRVVENLVENAAKFSPDGGTVRILVRGGFALEDARPAPVRRRLARAGPLVAIAVEDEGPGVPDAEKDRIFERFYQAAGARRSRRRGVGLGLAICREIVDAHGGAIWVDDLPDRGSRFTVALPATIPAPPLSHALAR